MKQKKKKGDEMITHADMNELKEQAKKRFIEVQSILKTYNIDRRAIKIYKDELVKEGGEFNRES